MSRLHQAVDDYLTIRRAMGFKLALAGRLLPQFVDHLSEVGATSVTVEHALAWARMPADSTIGWWAQRLSVVRGFATWLAVSDPATEVPPRDLLPGRARRATPYLYSREDITALLAAAGCLRPKLRAATYQTLISLLVVTGMRIGEAIALDRDDLDIRCGLLLVRSGKFDKDRLLPLHATTVEALHDHLRLRDQLYPGPDTPAMLINTRGRRLGYGTVQDTFRQLTQQAGLTPRPSGCRPRLHDLRHSFVVAGLLDAYRAGDDVQLTLPVLSTYLGHVDPVHTYWYLSAAPELLALAGQRLDEHLGGRP